jgi:hypothetical protein
VKSERAHAPWLVRLPKDDLLVLPVHRAPATDAPLQRTADPATEVGVAPEHLLEDGDCTQPRRSLQQRHDLRLEDGNQGIWPAPFPRRLLLRRQARILLDAVCSGDADRRLGGRHGG